MVEAQAIKNHKDQGNEYYKAELWLKAAACYTKGIKEEPDNSALYRYTCARAPKWATTLCQSCEVIFGIAAIDVRPF